MKLKYTYEIMEIDDQLMAIPVGDSADETHSILKLNESAAAILGLLKDDLTEEEIIQKLLEDYDSSEEELRNSVYEYTKQLKEAGLVV